MSGIKIIPPGEMVDRTSPGVNPFLTVLVERGVNDQPILFTIAQWQSNPHPRSQACVEYLKDLHGRATRRSGSGGYNLESGDKYPFIFQAADDPVDTPSISWQTMSSWSSIALVPDQYYFNGGGYGAFWPTQPAWADRRDQALWRGSTTGMLALTGDTLETLPRYRLCRIAAGLGKRADVGIVAIVQPANEDEERFIAARLEAEKLMRPFVDVADMVQYKMIIDIDGNASAWNFIQRLKLGCCILKVESEWRQWFQGRLQPWRHYIPIASDMSDLDRKIDWCLSNDVQAAEIAHQGRAFALAMSFEEEMDQAAYTVFPPC